MAINEQGYVRPTYEDILAGRIEQAKELFGDDIDTSDASPLGKFIRLAVQYMHAIWNCRKFVIWKKISR